MKIKLITEQYGKNAKNLVDNITLNSSEGAFAALETFYYSFNHKDINTFNKIWIKDDFIQLNNPLGGIVRGIDNISNIYQKIFKSNANVWVEFYDIVSYEFDNCFVFAGREKGFFSNENSNIELNIRTTRLFAYVNGKWGQIHHHGSIDNPDLLIKYQNAVK